MCDSSKKILCVCAGVMQKGQCAITYQANPLPVVPVSVRSKALVLVTCLWTEKAK